MDNEKIKIVNHLKIYLSNYDLIKKISKSNISDFEKINDSEFIRLLQADSKLIVDFFVLSEGNWTLSTYLFNIRGYLESSYKLNVDAKLNKETIISYEKLPPYLDSGSELENIRNIAIENFQKHNENQQKIALELEKNSKGILSFFRKILKLDKPKLQLDEPDIEYFQTKELIEKIVTKQLSLIGCEN